MDGWIESIVVHSSVTLGTKMSINTNLSSKLEGHFVYSYLIETAVVIFSDGGSIQNLLQMRSVDIGEYLGLGTG